MVLAQVTEILNKIAPLHFALSFDKVGLQLGDPTAEIHEACIALDHSLGSIEFAESKGCELMVFHHPLIWEPLKSIRADFIDQRLVLRLARAGIAAYAAHTNWDCARGGVNDALADALGLKNVVSFGPGNPVPMISLVTYIPESDSHAIQTSLSQAGIGTHGEYSGCSFSSSGIGSFTPLSGSNPTIGEIGVAQIIQEHRLEWLIPAALVPKARSLILEHHPYEKPVILEAPVAPEEMAPIGRIGELPQAQTLAMFQRYVNEALGTHCLVWGDPEESISKVAVIGGAAGSHWMDAQNAGADVFMTGEIPQNHAIDANTQGFPVIAAGHYATEQPGMRNLQAALQKEVPAVKWHLFEPQPGFCGRPE